jgi:glycosyltransferase EpsH
MNHPIVSVVITVFNNKKYIGKCIRSVLCQSFQDLEIILVNDGSTDGSLNVCQKYAKKDQRIRIIDKPNGGLIDARKDGMLLAKGEYVSFLDGDDYIEKKAIGKLMNQAQKYNLDMVIGNYDRVFDNWGLVTKKKAKFEKTYNEKAYKLIGNEEFTEQVLRLDLTKGMGVETLIWGRIYRRNCIIAALKNDESHLFPPDKFAVNEDAIFNLAITPYIHSCKCWHNGRDTGIY